MFMKLLDSILPVCAFLNECLFVDLVAFCSISLHYA